MGLTVLKQYSVFSGGASQIIDRFNPLPVKESKTAIVYKASGGSESSFFSTEISGEVIPFPKIKEGSTAKFHRIIKYISSCFSLTKDELAAICKVQSRKTLYNWADGVSKPRPSTMERIFDLLMIAKAWRQAGFPNDYEFSHRSSIDDASIFDMLKDDLLDRDKILFVGSRLVLFHSKQEPLKDPFEL